MGSEDLTADEFLAELRGKLTETFKARSTDEMSRKMIFDNIQRLYAELYSYPEYAKEKKCSLRKKTSPVFLTTI